MVIVIHPAAVVVARTSISIIVICVVGLTVRVLDRRSSQFCTARRHFFHANCAIDVIYHDRDSGCGVNGRAGHGRVPLKVRDLVDSCHPWRCTCLDAMLVHMSQRYWIPRERETRRGFGGRWLCWVGECKGFRGEGWKYSGYSKTSTTGCIVPSRSRVMDWLECSVSNHNLMGNLVIQLLTHEAVSDLHRTMYHRELHPKEREHTRKSRSNECPF